MVGPQALPTLAPPAVPLRTLRRALSRAQRPIFLINDSARIMPRDQPDVLSLLWAEAGEPTILVATGTHRGKASTLQDRLGLPVELHDADDARAHIALDDPAGPRIDRRVAQADLILAFGSVEPHYFAGWSGAHKTATVGVLDRESIARNHAHAVDPRALPLALEGNPVFDDLAAILAILEENRRLLAVNHVLDERGRPVGVGVGTWRGSLNRCLRTARERFVRPVAEPVDVLVAQVEGVLGRSLYQADKGLKNNEAVLRDGGDLILAAALTDGVGPDRFVTVLAEAKTAKEAAAGDYVLGDHKAIRWRRLEERGVRVRVVSPNLDSAAVAAAGLEVHGTLRAALQAVADDGRGQAGRGLVVNDAGLVVCALPNPSSTAGDPPALP